MLRVGGFPSGEAAEGSRMVLIKCSILIKKAIKEINGPDIHVCTTVAETGLRTVHLSFDASKFPFSIKCGIPEKHVSFAGTSPHSVPEAEMDALRKVADYLFSKFGVRFADWSYEKLQVVEKKVAEAEAIINATFNNLNNILGNCKACIGILVSAQKTISHVAHPFQASVSEELLNLKSEVQACLHHISSEMKSANTLHTHCCKGSTNNPPEDVVIIKICERDILDQILLSLGFKKANFSNTLLGNIRFTGSCKININDTCTSRTTGKTTINGDVKKSAYEAECSAAAKAIDFIESVLSMKVVDLNYPVLLEKQASLNCLLKVKSKYHIIQNLVLNQWRIMIDQLKGLANSKFEACKQLNLSVDEEEKAEIEDIMNEIVGDMTMLYELSTVDLYQDSS